MAELWYWLIALMLTAWAVLDGFDFGAGILHRFVAKTDAERQQVLGSVKPVFDGNEVWLIATGGSLYFAFPKLMAAAFSGFYLPIIFVVWALLLRGGSLELRSHVGNSLWRSFFDTVFTLSSFGVPFLMGVLLGNLVRGVPLQQSGSFELGLFGTEGELGVLDGYSFVCGLLTLIIIAAHGANWLVWKTEGEVNVRARALRSRLWGVALGLWVATIFFTSRVAPDVISGKPLVWVGLIVALGGMGTFFAKRHEELKPFLGGAAFVAGVLVMIAASLFPVLLRANDPTRSLTVDNASTASGAMSGALLWVIPGLVLAAGYLWWVLRHFQGKVVNPHPDPLPKGEGGLSPGSAAASGGSANDPDRTGHP